MAKVTLSNLCKRFGSTRVIDDFSMTIADGEFVTIVGPSGCGKSTLLRCIAGLESISGGELHIDGRLSNRIDPRDRGIAMVFQSYALFPHMSVAANIAFGLKVRGVAPADRQRKVDWALKLLHLDGLGKRLPRELSGGQRQRVAIGRALVLEPKALLLDEPLSNLDAKLRLQMRTEFKRLHRATGRTTIYVTHDQVEAMTLSDRIAILADGRAQQICTPDEIYRRPANRFVADFIGSPPINLIPVEHTHTDGETVLRAGSLRVRAAALRTGLREALSNSRGVDLILGIRPEHLSVGQQGATGADGRVRVSVDVLEPLGNSVIAVTRMGAHTLTAVLPSDIPLDHGRELDLAFSATNVHLFDKATGAALTRAS